MMITTSNTWLEANQHALTAELTRIHTLLDQHAATMSTHADKSEGESGALSAPEAAPGSPVDNLIHSMPNVQTSTPHTSALEVLCALFGLSPFERDVLLLCAGTELDSAFAPLYCLLHNNPLQPYPTFGLALSILPNTHWSALLPDAPLRHWHLLTFGNANGTANPLTGTMLRIDERILHYLVGFQTLDEHLVGIIKPLIKENTTLVPSHLLIAEQIVASWGQAKEQTLPPVVVLHGADRADKQAIAVQVCRSMTIPLSSISTHSIPLQANEFVTFTHLWEREVALTGGVLLLEYEDLDTNDPDRERAITQFCETIHGMLIVSSRALRHLQQRPVLIFAIGKPARDEQRTLWHTTLSTTAAHLNGNLDMLVAQFDLNTSTIATVCAEVLSHLNDTLDTSDITQLVWDTCRTQTRTHLNDLAQRIETVATWDDLVLPETQLQILHDIGAHVRQRAKVYQAWGFATKGARGLGISALFAGVSGTGKTMAAEVLANELHLDLYRIDLSQIINKYIGETEKNLRQVFDMAEESGAILLFDEADALFGKRSEVKDSHDRYANIEVSYLLQRVETYRGLAILTTNIKSALDAAFLRRIRFIVQFPFPDSAQRIEIWRRIFPQKTPTEGLDEKKLARLNITGGNIRNVALNAAFLAADADEAIKMEHILRAARSEYIKLEKTLTEIEIGGWL
jgi:ATPase family associated with various cellular activities (AAA)